MGNPEYLKDDFVIVGGGQNHSRFCNSWGWPTSLSFSIGGSEQVDQFKTGVSVCQIDFELGRGKLLAGGSTKLIISPPELFQNQVLKSLGPP